jgi:hypothetical protein
MNPPTIGHELLIKRVETVARRVGGKPKVYLSGSYDNKKNPLVYKYKVRICQQAFGHVIQSERCIHFIDMVKKQDCDNLIVVVGSDRVPEMTTLLNKYNGKEYSFKSIRVVSAGERDPDDDSVSGMSASKMREFAKANDLKSFKKGLPNHLKKDAKTIMQHVRGGLKL